MTDELPKQPDVDTPEAGSVTGVATGSVGTGTALDDTQVYQAQDLIDERDLPPLSEGAILVDADTDGRAPVASPPVASAPVRRIPVSSAPLPRARRRRGNPVVGVAAVIGAAALVVLAATALLGNHGNGNLGAGQTLPTFDTSSGGSTPSPSDSAADSGRGHGNGNDNKTHKP